MGAPGSKLPGSNFLRFHSVFKENWPRYQVGTPPLRLALLIWRILDVLLSDGSFLVGGIRFGYKSLTDFLWVTLALIFSELAIVRIIRTTYYRNYVGEFELQVKKHK